MERFKPFMWLILMLFVALTFYWSVYKQTDSHLVHQQTYQGCLRGNTKSIILNLRAQVVADALAVVADSLRATNPTAATKLDALAKSELNAKIQLTDCGLQYKG